MILCLPLIPSSLDPTSLSLNQSGKLAISPSLHISLNLHSPLCLPFVRFFLCVFLLHALQPNRHFSFLCVIGLRAVIAVSIM